MHHLQEEVPRSILNDDIPSNQAKESHSSLKIILVKDTRHNVQELFQKSPQNCKRKHVASTYFEELSQKLQRISPSQIVSHKMMKTLALRMLRTRFSLPIAWCWSN